MKNKSALFWALGLTSSMALGTISSAQMPLLAQTSASCRSGSPYHLESGDTLYLVAQSQLGNGNFWSQITNPDGSSVTSYQNLQVGQLICLPPNQVGTCQFGNPYRIESGDTLYLVAQSQLGDGNLWSQITNSDGSTIPNSQNLQVNQLVCLPNSGSNSSHLLFVGYFQSWSEKWSTDPSQLELANLPSYVNMVNVSFIKPDATYTPGSYDLSGTGLNFSVNPNGAVIKNALALLKQKNPTTKVLLSVGGASYKNFSALNTTAIAAVVKDFGFDGVEIDYEPDQAIANCSSLKGQISCATDAEFRNIVDSIRQALPKPYLNTVAAVSIGAYGEGQWASSQPSGPWTGLLLNLLKSSDASNIDQVNVMSYDAGTTYNPKDALAAYQNYFKGKIVMGVEVPPEASGQHVYTISEVDNLSKIVRQGNAAGMMLWSLQKTTSQTPSSSNPNAQMISTEICQQLSLSNCSQSLGF